MNKILITTQIITIFSVLLLSAPAQAAPISVGNIENIFVADKLIGTSNSSSCESVKNETNCDFVQPTSSTTYLNLNNAGVANVVTDNPASYLLSPFKDSTFIDLGFNDVSLYNGEGDDLVVFIVGHTTSFGIDVLDINNNSLFSDTYDVPTPVFDNTTQTFTDTGDTVFNTDGTWVCVSGTGSTCTNGTALSAAFFDLGNTVAGDTAIDRIRIHLGEDYNGPDGTRPRFSLAGGFHTEATVVPLPLPIILFASGLSLLGLFGHRKRTK